MPDNGYYTSFINRAINNPVKLKGRGYVYFIQSSHGGPIKIGFSTNPEHRLATLQTANPHPLKLLAVLPGIKETEKDLHAMFGRSKHHGEWYEATRDLIRFIGLVKAACCHPTSIDESIVAVGSAA